MNLPKDMTEETFIKLLDLMTSHLKKSHNKNVIIGGHSFNYHNFCEWLYNHPLNESK